MEDYYVISYNEVDLNYFIGIKEIRRQILPERTNYAVEMANAHGQFYTGYKYNPRIIEVDFFMDNITPNKMRNLATLLDTSKPCKLTLSDEPGVFYMAVVDGSVDMDELLNLGTGKITFICHDPHAYSEHSKVFEGEANGVVTVANTGNVETHPTIEVEFGKKAHFVQATNYTGETILIGQRPTTDKPTVEANSIIVNDDCSTLTNWSPSGNILDSDVPRLVEGTMGIGLSSGAIIPSNCGATNDAGWHGPAMRRNIGTNLKDFHVTARIKFDALGSPNTGDGSNGGTNTKPPTGGAIYQSTASSGVRIRSGRGTKFKRLTAVPKGKQCTITDIQNNWGKITYGGHTGYTCMTYWKFIKNNPTTLADEKPKPISYENKMARMELYGMSQSGAKLFKFVFHDSEFFYEYAQPEIWIGNHKALHDNKTCPKPKVEKVKKENYGSSTGDSSGSSNTGSGSSGSGSSTTNPNTKGDAVVSEAKRHIGKPYSWGATGPSRFDCSGFIYYSMKTAGVGGGRLTALGYRNACKTVSRSSIQKGDLVFWNDKTGNKHSKVYHVGLYCGGNEIVDCSTDHKPGVGTRQLSSLQDGSKRYFTFGRYPKMGSSSSSKSIDVPVDVPNYATRADEYEEIEVNSGRYGEWNEFYGDFDIRTSTNSKGQRSWVATINKIVNGKSVGKITGQFAGDHYPQEPLNNLVLWYGQHNDSPVCDDMGLLDLKVRALKPIKEKENAIIFNQGDNLRIETSENKVYLNDKLYMEDLDIGSEFFTSPNGRTQIRVISDDDTLDVVCGITERYI